MKNIKKFNKLVRDLIPEIIKNNGDYPVIKKLNKESYQSALVEKLIEEANEFRLNPSLEEAADLLEVLDALFAEHKLDKRDVLSVQKQKRKNRGGFLKKLFLVRTYQK